MSKVVKGVQMELFVLVARGNYNYRRESGHIQKRVYLRAKFMYVILITNILKGIKRQMFVLISRSVFIQKNVMEILIKEE
jgi:hypothetical protein